MGSFQTNILIFRNLLKTISFQRCFNLFQLFLSYCISVIIKRPILIGMPWGITIEPTNTCNLKCPECPTGTNGLSRPAGNIDVDLFQKIIKETRKNAFFLNLYFQGEPFLNKNLTSFIEMAKENRFFTSCATNAHYINEEIAKRIVSSGLDHLVISFDGATQEVYEKYRIGGDFEKVISAIRLLVKEKEQQQKKYPLILLQFLILKHNEHQIREVKELAKKLGADRLVFKTAQLYDLNTENPYLPDNPLYSRYKKTTKGKLKLVKTQKNRCWKAWSSCVITWDGRVVPCCFDKDAVYCYGSIDKSSFRQIIYSSKSREFKANILQNRKWIDICTNCTEGGYIKIP